MTDLEQAKAILGKHVQFNHQDPDVEPMLVEKIIDDKFCVMVKVSGMVGHFHPSLFRVVDV